MNTAQVIHKAELTRRDVPATVQGAVNRLLVQCASFGEPPSSAPPSQSSSAAAAAGSAPAPLRVG